MALQEDAIVDIKESQVRFFGSSGKMLLPSQSTVEAYITKIPMQKLVTTNLLRKELTEQYKYRVPVL